MFEIVDVDCWETFTERWAMIEAAERRAGRAQFLFRGLADSGFTLSTTLERAGRLNESISRYYHTICKVQPQIETFGHRVWNLPDWPEMDAGLKEYDTLSLHRFPQLDTYSFMVHLRHHGFPSPLLDWTGSPFVESFFAFRHGVSPSTGKVAIWAFSEKVNGKVSGSGEPRIRRVGPFVRTHKRHFLQQSDYTIGVLFDAKEGWRFAEHEAMFALSESHQDFLWKFTIPWTERIKVLKALDRYNLNAFSLFDSEDTLMETMALRALL